MAAMDLMTKTTWPPYIATYVFAYALIYALKILSTLTLYLILKEQSIGKHQFLADLDLAF